MDSIAKINMESVERAAELAIVRAAAPHGGQLKRGIFSLAAAFGVFGGISSLASGILCVVIHSILHGDSAFGQVGTALLIGGIPMLLIGSILLDEIEG